MIPVSPQFPTSDNLSLMSRWGRGGRARAPGHNALARRRTAAWGCAVCCSPTKTRCGIRAETRQRTHRSLALLGGGLVAWDLRGLTLGAVAHCAPSHDRIGTASAPASLLPLPLCCQLAGFGRSQRSDSASTAASVGCSDLHGRTCPPWGAARADPGAVGLRLLKLASLVRRCRRPTLLPTSSALPGVDRVV